MKNKFLAILLFIILIFNCKIFKTINNKTEEVEIIKDYPHVTSINFNINGCYIGAMIDWQTCNEGVSWELTKDDINVYQKIIDNYCPIIGSYIAFKYSGKFIDFPINKYYVINNNNSIMLATWEPRDWDQSNPEYSNKSILPDILSGKYNLYIDSWANAIKKLDKPILLRFAHEMNGNWYPWSGIYNGGKNKKNYPESNLTDGPTTYINAYRYIVNRFRYNKVTNVYWVWTPNRENLPNEEWNHYSKYYPGDDYVDIIAMDAYNWGNTQPWSKWQSFDDLFKDFYNDLISLYPDKVIFIGEFSSAHIGGNKAEWIVDAFTKIKSSYPKIKAFIWLHVDNTKQVVNNLNENSNWCVDSSPESENSMKLMMKDKYFLNKIIYNK